MIIHWNSPKERNEVLWEYMTKWVDLVMKVLENSSGN